MSARALVLIVTLFIALPLRVPVSRAQSSAPIAPVSDAKPELRIGCSTWVGYGPLFLAREKKYFDEAGVSLVLVKGRPSEGQGCAREMEDPKRRFAALADGRLDGLGTTMDTMTRYWKPTFQFQAVLGLADSNGGDGIIAKDSIKSIPDLRGMKVAYNEGSVSHFFLSVLLRENGMTEKDIQGVNMRQDDAGSAFMHHEVDAAVTWEPWLTKARKTPGGHVLVDSSSTPGVIMDVLLFRREVIESHPDAIRAVIRGWYRAVDYWKKNPDESNALMAKEVGGWLKDVKTFKETLGGVRYYDQAINEQYFAPGGQIYATAQKALEIWTALGHIPLAGAATDLIEPEFVRELIPLFSSPSGVKVSAQTTQRTSVSFDVANFDLPGPGWQQTTATPRQIGYTRKMGDGKSQSIAFWPVTFPPSLQGRSQQEHASAIFDIERQKPRYEGRWEGFVEGTREIAGRQFPTMRFTVTLAAQRLVTDGLFVLYFPDDFDQRRKFFTFMWLDGHPQDQPGTGLEVLDTIVASTRINH